MKVGSVRKPLILSPHMQPNVGRGKIQKTIVNEPLRTKIADVVRYTITDPLVRAAEATKHGTKMALQTASYFANVTSDACRRSFSSTQKAASLVFPWLANTVFFSLTEKTVQVGRWTTNSVLSPIGQSVIATKNFITALPQNTVSHVIQPPISLIGRLAIWTYSTTVTPVVAAVNKSAKAVFITFPSFVRNDVCTKVLEQTKRLATSVNQGLVSPVAQVAQNIATLALIKLPKALNDRVIVPLAKGVVFAATTTCVATSKTMQAVIQAPRFVVNNVVAPTLTAALSSVRWTYGKTSSGIATTAQAIISGPRFVVNNVAMPAVNGALSSVQWTYGKISNATVQTAQAIISGPRFVANNVVMPAANGTFSGVKWTYGKISSGTLKSVRGISNALFVRAPSAVNERLVAPVVATLSLGASSVSNFVLRPVMQTAVRAKELVFIVPKSISSLAATVTTGPRVIHNAVIAPIANKIVSVVETIFAACKYAVCQKAIPAVLAGTQYVTSTASNTVIGAYSAVTQLPATLRSFVPVRWQQTKASV